MIILASASARRVTLLQAAGLEFKTLTSQINEGEIKMRLKEPKILAVQLALAKALAIKDQVKNEEDLIISADTLVILDKLILGKPKSYEEALRMLKHLSGKTHQVITGLVVLGKLGKKVVDYGVTKVSFKRLTDQKIKAYLKTGVYLDRAGAYGVQDEKCDFVKSYQGSFSNILGLPMEKLGKILKGFGIVIKRD